jgi:di/tricarboxylate transporter
LPDRKSAIDTFIQSDRKYLVEAEIRKGSKYIGQSINEAGLRNQQGLYLVEIIRNDHLFQVIDEDFILEEGDMLRFAGDNQNVASLLSSSSGLTVPSVGMMSKLKRSQVVEIVISHNSTLITKQVKEIYFRGKYDSALLAIHRNGERIVGKIDDVKLKAGDVLLLLAGENFTSRIQNDIDFYLISRVKELCKPERYKIWVLFGGTLLAIFLAAVKLVPLFIGLLIVLAMINILKVVSAKDLPKNIDYNLGVIIALSLALGIAMKKTGVADMIANLIISVFLPMGRVMLLFGIYIITAVLAAYITNKAAVAIVFPISIAAADKVGLEDPMPFILIVSFAAAANFITPIGYQTNLMVYGPGGYNFKDFFKIGFPLTIIYMLVTVAILSYMYF